MRPSARLRRLLEGIARLLRRAVRPAPHLRCSRPADARHSFGGSAGRDELPDAANPRDPTEDVDLHEALPFGDFTDQDEVQRFAGLPPIGAEALEGVDWDELARELTGPR